jgi:hypothetical protein
MTYNDFTYNAILIPLNAGDITSNNSIYNINKCNITNM